jgi:hypothetical protein
LIACVVRFAGKERGGAFSVIFGVVGFDVCA